MTRKTFRFHGWAAMVSGAALLALLTGCVGDMPHRGAWVAAPHNQVVQAAFVVPEPVLDQYLYYPSYAIYYNRTRPSYVYLEKGVWVTRSVPTRVALAVLQASPAVPMDFHDAPALHHASVLRDYPASRHRSESDRRLVRGTRASGGNSSGAVK